MIPRRRTIPIMIMCLIFLDKIFSLTVYTVGLYTVIYNHYISDSFLVQFAALSDPSCPSVQVRPIMLHFQIRVKVALNYMGLYSRIEYIHYSYKINYVASG